MKKLILLSVIAMSILVARDCRYEEQELNMLIRQYEDLQDEFRYEIERAEDLINSQYNNSFNQSLIDYTHNLDKAQEIQRKQLKASFEKDYLINQETQLIQKKYNIRFNRLNQRIKQQKQRLNNCRNGK